MSAILGLDPRWVEDTVGARPETGKEYFVRRKSHTQEQIAEATSLLTQFQAWSTIGNLWEDELKAEQTQLVALHELDVTGVELEHPYTYKFYTRKCSNRRLGLGEPCTACVAFQARWTAMMADYAKYKAKNNIPSTLEERCHELGRAGSLKDRATLAGCALAHDQVWMAQRDAALDRIVNPIRAMVELPTRKRYRE